MRRYYELVDYYDDISLLDGELSSVILLMRVWILLVVSGCSRNDRLLVIVLCALLLIFILT